MARRALFSEKLPAKMAKREGTMAHGGAQRGAARKTHGRQPQIAHVKAMGQEQRVSSQTATGGMHLHLDDAVGDELDKSFEWY